LFFCTIARNKTSVSKTQSRSSHMPMHEYSMKYQHVFVHTWRKSHTAILCSK